MPGRYITGPSLVDMAEHYLGVPATPAERAEAQQVAELRDVTPAWVEQCCAEAATVRELLAALGQ